MLFESALAVVCILAKASWTPSPWWLSPLGQSVTRELLLFFQRSLFVLRIQEKWTDGKDLEILPRLRMGVGGGGSSISLYI